MVAKVDLLEVFDTTEELHKCCVYDSVMEGKPVRRGIVDFYPDSP
jgi:hypothetical protein